MDELHAVALEEIALEGRQGCSLSLLWQLLEPRLPAGLPQLTPHLKQHLWLLLRSEASGLTYSTVELQAQAKEAAKQAGPQKKAKKKKKKGDEDEAEQPQIETEVPLEAVPEDVLQAEEAGVVVVAPVSARLAVVGVYDELEAGHKLSEHQLAVLEMVGQRRHHGAVQTDMANELGVQHRNFFYVLKMLEARHMIVRNKLMVPMPANSNSSGWSTTSIVHLPRYAPRVVLGAEAVFKEVQTAQGQQLQQQAVQQQGQGSGNYVVRDDATVMQQICDFLGSQNGRYVSESQVKAVLGFTGSPTAHRQWRRLRTRLIKIGCIKAELGMIGDRGISVLRLVKPFKLRLPVVVNSDEEQEEAAGGDDGDEADEAADKTAADEADAEAEAAEGAEGAAATGANKLPVEVGREQLMLELLCEAGPEGILTPELSKKLGSAPRVLLRSLPELCRKYGMKVEYDMPNKALTNRLIAPEHLREKYNQQRHLLGMTEASAAPQQHPAATAAQEQQDAAAAGRQPQAPAAAAVGEVAVAAEPDHEQQQQQQKIASASAGAVTPALSVRGGKTSAAAPAAQPAPGSAGAAGDRQAHKQQPAPATAAVAGDDTAADMEVDDFLEEALDEALRQSTAATRPNVPSTAVQESAEGASNDPSAVAAAAALVTEHPSAGAARGQNTTTAAAVTAHNMRAPARRLAGLSTHQSAAHATGSTAALLAQGAMYRVRTVSTTRPLPGQTAASEQQHTAHAAAQLADTANTVGSSSFGTQGGISRLQQRRLQVLKDHLQEAGFMMKQELRRLIMNSEVQPASQQRPHNLYDYTGPDTKTCNRLYSLLVDCGAAKLVKLQYHREAVLEPKEVEVLIHQDVEQTPELLQRIAVYDAELPGNLRREGMRRALMAQGLVGKPAAHVEAAEAGSSQLVKGGFAGLGLLIDSKQVQLLPVPSNVRSLPGYGLRSNVGGDGAADNSTRSRGRGGGRGRRRGLSLPVESGGGDAAAAAAAVAADETQAGAYEAAAGAMPGSQQANTHSKAIKGQEIQQLHHNGYIPSLMLRAKLLHQYLCACVHMKTEPHDDIPQSQVTQAADANGQQHNTLTSSGYAPNSRGSKAQWLRFVIAGSHLDEQRQQQQQQQDADASADKQDAGLSAGLFQLSRPARIIAEDAAAATTPTTAAAEAATAASTVGADEEPVQQGATAESDADDVTRKELEEQLGGRLLSVEKLWLSMPLTVAVLVGGTHLRVSNLLDLLSQTDPIPTVSSFEPSQQEVVLGQKAWRRVVGSLAVLTKLKLITPAKRGTEQSWTQCHPTKATHLVIGTVGVLDEPTQSTDVAPACLRYDFTEEGKWGLYWTKMQSMYDTTLFTKAQLQRFFPASVLPDVARHRCWTSYREMSLIPFLRLQARLHGLPVEQLDMHLARQVSEELNLPYSQVHPLVTRLRTEINEQREKAGLEKIYLLKGAEGGAAETDGIQRSGSAAKRSEREKRRRKHEKRRLKRLKRQQQQQDGTGSMAEGCLTAADSGSESDSESGDESDTEAAAAEQTGGYLDRSAATAGLPPRPPKPLGKKRKVKQSQRSGTEGATAADGAASVSSDSDMSAADGQRQRKTPGASGRQLPRITIRLAPEGETAADSRTAAAGDGDGSTAAAAGGSELWDSDDAGRPAASQHDTAATGGGVDRSDDVDVAGSEGVPARIAVKRHRWTPQQDRQLLKWVVQQRVELGTRVQVRWQHAAPGLPLRVDLCTRRFNFLKKNKASSKFLASLEAQAVELHREYSTRRIALQQQLTKMQQQSRLSINPVLLQQQQQDQAGDAAANQATAEQGLTDQQQQQQGTQPQPLLVPAGYDPPLQPLPGGQQQQQQQGQLDPTSTSGGPGTAAAWLAVAGPHQVTAQGHIILLPTDSIKAKYNKLMDQIDEFTTPRQQQFLELRKRRAAAAAARAGEGGPVALHRQQQRRRRRQGRMSDYEQVGFDDDAALGDSDAGISSGESDVDEWALLTNAAGSGAAAAAARGGQHRRGSGPQKRRGSRQVRPLKTVADRVAHSHALLAAAAAAAATVIAKRRAAGEVIDSVDEERERQLQLQAYIEGNRKKRNKQRRHLGPAISNPRDLIQSWRLHHAGVETRPAAAAKAQQPAAAVADGDKAAVEAMQDSTAAAAVVEDDSPEAPTAAEAMETSAAAELVVDAAAAAGSSAAAATSTAVASWTLGPAPGTPVVTAMHLITSLLHLVADAGSLPADASLALLLRFSQAEVAAAFRWLRALGWLNSGAARRPFQLSGTWSKRLRGEGVLADLLDRTPAAQLALRRIGVLGSAVTTAAAADVADGDDDGVDLSAAGVQQSHGVAVSNEAVLDGLSQQLLVGLQRLERDKARADEVRDKQKDKQQQQQQRSPQQQAVKACDEAADAIDVDQQVSQQQAAVMGADDGSKDATLAAAHAGGHAAAAAVEPPPAAVADSPLPVAEGVVDHDAEKKHQVQDICPAPGQQGELTDAAAVAAPSTPKAVVSCLSVLHSVTNMTKQDDGSSVSRRFWVGLQPATPSVTTEPAAADHGAAITAAAAGSKAVSVSGGLLMEVILSAAAGQLELTLVAKAHARRTSGRVAARGEAATLSHKPPQLLVQLAAAAAAHPLSGDQQGDATANSEETEAEAATAAGVTSAAASAADDRVLLVPRSGSGDSTKLMAYCGDYRGTGLHEAEVTAPQTPSSKGETATAAVSRKRPRDSCRLSSVATQRQQFSALDVGRDAAVRQQAEDACYEAALLSKTQGICGGDGSGEGADLDIDDSSARPSKTQKVSQQGQAVVDNSSSSSICSSEFVCALLSAVRAAGSQGLSTSQLLQQYQQAVKDGERKETAVEVDDTDGVQPPLILDVRDSVCQATAPSLVHDSSEAGAAAVAQPDAAATQEAADAAMQDTAVPAAPAAEVVNAFVALPYALKAMSGAAAAAAMSSGMTLLQEFGLVRHVAGWQEHMWLAAEHSDRLLAWPLTQHKEQQQTALSPKQQDNTGSAQPRDNTEQQQQPTYADATLDVQHHTSIVTDSGANVGETATAGVTTNSAAHCSDGSSSKTEQPDKVNSSSSSGEVLVMPWLDHKGRLNTKLWQSLVKRIMGVVLRNPGIPEALLVGQLDVVSPAAVKEAISILLQQKHLVARSVASSGPLGNADQVTRDAQTAATAGPGVVASNHDSSTVIAKKLASSSGSSGYGGWGGGAVALRLGAGLTGYTPAPGQPPSLFVRRSKVEQGVVADAVADSQREVHSSKQPEVVHYWPSLLTCTTCHLTCVPPCVE